MSLDDVDLDTALKLLSLPRVVGNDPEPSEEITAQNGRYGPYLKKGTDSRSLDRTRSRSSTSRWTRRWRSTRSPSRAAARGSAKPPLREFGEDPVNGKPVVAKEGRFGPYITDGETNVTVPRGTTVEELTVERALDLLAEKRAKGPAAKKTARRRRAGQEDRREEDDHGEEDRGRHEENRRPPRRSRRPRRRPNSDRG